MKPKTIQSILAAALLAPGALFAQTTATTTPVGYVSLGDTTIGQPAVKANTDSYIAIPLFNTSDYSGLVDSVSGSTVNLLGTPGFTAGQFASPTNPYYFVVESGPLSGLVGTITANGASSVTVATQFGDSISTLANGAKITIRKAWTLKSFFTGNTIPTGTLVSVYGGASGINVSADAIYEYDGTGWIDTDTLDGADDVILYPGEGFKLRTPAGSPITSLVVSGEVPTNSTRTLIDKKLVGVAQDNMISYFSPTGEVIGASGLGLTSGDLLIEWSNSAAGINKASITILEFDGTDWTDTDTLDTVTNTFVLQGGKAYRYRRAASAAVGVVPITDTKTYMQP